MNASHNGKEAAVDYLLSVGADVNKSNKVTYSYVTTVTLQLSTF
jgi:hypothetical protein